MILFSGGNDRNNDTGTGLKVTVEQKDVNFFNIDKIVRLFKVLAATKRGINRGIFQFQNVRLL